MTDHTTATSHPTAGRRIDRLPIGALLALTTAALALMVGGLAVATASFEASGIASDLFAVQLAFDADVIRAQYAGLVERGTFDVYVRTQVLDYLFIAGLAAFGWLFHALIARAHTPGSRWHRIARIGGRLVLASAAFDAVENLVSFALLVDPTGFPAALAAVYSSLAAAKWLLAGAGVPLLLAQLAALATRVVPGRRRRGAIAAA